MILQADPKAGYLAQRRDIDAAMARVASSGWYILGKECAAFERDFARWSGAGHAVGVGNGTDAIIIALKALDVGAGDVVFTVSHTAVALAPILAAGPHEERPRFDPLRLLRRIRLGVGSVTHVIAEDAEPPDAQLTRWLPEANGSA